MRVAAIIPCHNEAYRIDKQAFVKADSRLTFVFVNDGSTDSTLEVLQDIQKNRPETVVVNLPTNRGKGNAIQSAYTQLSAEYWSEFDWIGFLDCDLATPIREVSRLLYGREPQEFDAIWASRSPKAGSPLRRLGPRGILGKIFNLVVQSLFKIKIYDTQCGAKFFSGKSAALAFAQPFLSRWIFDIEIYLRLQGTRIQEAPLHEWREVPGSRMRVFRDALIIAVDLYRIAKSQTKLKQRT